MLTNFMLAIHYNTTDRCWLCILYEWRSCKWKRESHFLICQHASDLYSLILGLPDHDLWGGGY